MSKRLLEQLALWVGLSLGLLACASSSGTPTTVDAAIEHATDVPTDHGNADRAETSTTPDAREVGTDLGSDQADAHDGGPGGNGSGGAGMGGSGMGGSGMGGSGMGGAGVGGSGMGGAGVGGQGGANAGSGGTSSGSGGAAPDAAPDMAAGGTDGGIDSPTDGIPATDATNDAAPACGAGCPANVQPADLVLWISADVGVTCDSSSPPRVTGWKDRTPGSTVTLAPVATKVGPRCDGAMLNGTPLPFFDRTTTDIDNGVLKVDLTPLDDSDYTVFVVERRRIANAGFILGTDVPAPLTGPNMCVDDFLDGLNAHLGYRFGYQGPTVFEAGSYTVDPNSYDCNEPSVTVSAFSTPQAALEIDFLAQGDMHTLTAGSMTNPSDDLGAMGSLMQGYLGRAFNLPLNSDSRYLGEVAEVVVYSVALSSSDVTAVSNYLRARWGI